MLKWVQTAVLVVTVAGVIMVNERVIDNRERLARIEARQDSVLHAAADAYRLRHAAYRSMMVPGSSADDAPR